MPKFFIKNDQINGDLVTIKGEDAHHISRSLRMSVGEHINVSDENGMEYECILDSFTDTVVTGKILNKYPSDAESRIRVHLFQALPKGEKLDFIIQKSVECGVYDITPFESERCVVKVKNDAEGRKTDRRNKIALEAAKQCGRGIVPNVNSTVGFEAMLGLASNSDAVLFCYEGEGTLPMGKVLKKLKNECNISDISIIIGSEGGFSPEEAEIARKRSFDMIGLGKRILRAETAAIMALSCLVYEFELV